MGEKSTELNLIQKLAKIRAMSDVVTRDKNGYNYKYTDMTSILASITAGMKKYKVSLIPQIVPESASVDQNVIRDVKVDKSGKSYEKVTTEMLVKADMIFIWINDDDLNDTLSVPWYLTGAQSDPSQAFGSGLTYCTRYFLINFFQIAQAQEDSDVDAYRSKQKEAEISEERAIAEAITGEIDELVKKYLADNPDKKDGTKKWLGRYAKNGNYFAITEPNIAAKLLDDFKNTFLDTSEED